MSETREPTPNELKRWDNYKKSFDSKTMPMIKGLELMGAIALGAQNTIKDITGSNPGIITEEQRQNIDMLIHRSQILQNQINGVLMKKYAIQMGDNDNLNIVGVSAPESDIYPNDHLNFGVAPIIVAAGIFAVTLLVAADDAKDALETKAKIEAIKLEKKMVKADLAMMKRPVEDRKQWSAWKDATAKKANTILKTVGGSNSWLESFFGRKSSTILTAGIIGIAAIYFLLPKFRRN